MKCVGIWKLHKPLGQMFSNNQGRMLQGLSQVRDHKCIEGPSSPKRNSGPGCNQRTSEPRLQWPDHWVSAATQLSTHNYLESHLRWPRLLWLKSPSESRSSSWDSVLYSVTVGVWDIVCGMSCVRCQMWWQPRHTPHCHLQPPEEFWAETSTQAKLIVLKKFQDEPG